jgi:trimeric autotransporter adhesin
VKRILVLAGSVALLAIAGETAHAAEGCRRPPASLAKACRAAPYQPDKHDTSLDRTTPATPSRSGVATAAQSASSTAATPAVSATSTPASTPTSSLSSPASATTAAASSEAASATSGRSVDPAPVQALARSTPISPSSQPIAHSANFATARISTPVHGVSTSTTTRTLAHAVGSAGMSHLGASRASASHTGLASHTATGIATGLARGLTTGSLLTKNLTVGHAPASVASNGAINAMRLTSTVSMSHGLLTTVESPRLPPLPGSVGSVARVPVL